MMNCASGGIIGSAWNGKIINSYNCGNVNGIRTNSEATSKCEVGGIVGYHKTGHIRGAFNVGTLSIQGTSTANTHIGGIFGQTYYACFQSVYNLGEIRIGDGVSAIAGAVYGLGYLTGENSAGYVEGTAEKPVGQGNASNIESMELPIDTLLEIMNEFASDEEMISFADGTNLSSWKKDDNISSLHPIMEWE